MVQKRFTDRATPLPLRGKGGLRLIDNDYTALIIERINEDMMPPKTAKTIPQNIDTIKKPSQVG